MSNQEENKKKVDQSKRNDTVELLAEFGEKMEIRTGRKYVIKLTKGAKLVIQLDINPKNITTHDDKYTLYSTDEGKTYKKTQTVKDDKVPGDAYIDLHFEGVKPDLKYTLEIDPGAEGDPYTVFENMSYAELAEGYPLEDKTEGEQ